MGVFSISCPHCLTDCVAFTIVWADNIYNRPLNLWIGTATCGRCCLPVSFKILGDGVHPNSYVGDILTTYSIIDLWPSLTPPSAPEFTPSTVATRFLEGEDAFSRRKWNSAVAMYRSALDIATRAMPEAPADVTFFRRLEALHSRNVITTQMRQWADHVRVEGNAALHDPESFSEQDAASLRLFTEMFLRYVFELPGKVEEFKNRTASA